MELRDVIATRRSIRKFKEDEVETTVIDKLVSLAVYAPSWKNTQVTRYYAVRDLELKKRLAEAVPEFNRQAVMQAPVIMVATMVRERSGYNRNGEFDTSKENGWQMYDCGLSNMLFCLAANEEGLGTVIMGLYDESAIEDIVGIPPTEEVATVIALGYPDEMPDMPKRKGTDIILKII